MVVVFFGTPQFAVPTLSHLLASRHPVCGVVTQPDRPRGRGQKVSNAPVKALAVGRGIPVVQPERLNDPAIADTLRSWDPDIGVVVAYGRLIPDRLLEIPRQGMINVHASLLPKYRGAAPVHRAVIAGEAVTGVTVMRVGQEFFVRRTLTGRSYEMTVPQPVVKETAGWIRVWAVDDNMLAVNARRSVAAANRRTNVIVRNPFGKKTDSAVFKARSEPVCRRIAVCTGRQPEPGRGEPEGSDQTFIWSGQD